jgi:hypothetical protein
MVMAKLNVAIVRKATVNIEVVENMDAAIEAAGLRRGAVDHGSVRMGNVQLGIVVWEHGLFERPDKMHYWAIGRSMYAGNAVIYGVDRIGDTVDLAAAHLPPIRFFRDHDAIEQAIQMGVIERPYTAVNGIELWRWPNPNSKYQRKV